jgi:hypothetical protein
VEKILPRLREKVELGCALGGLVFKPYVSGGALAVDYARADGVVPVRFDGSGRMVGVVFVDQRQVGDRYYTKFEHHDIGSGTIDTVTAGGQRVVEFEMDDAEKRRISRGFPGASINSEVKSGYIIRNYVLRSSTRDTLGQPAQLSEVPEWSGLKQRSIIPGIDRPLFAYFRYPQANNIDKTSPLGVSCYARADELIQQADTQWSDLMWEFKSGRRKMYVDNLAFGKDKDGNTIGPFDKDLYVALETPGSNIGDGNKLFEAWSPEFREAAIKSGLNAILRQIEFACGLAYGTISDPEVVAKTATEVATTRQRSYATVTDTQKALRAALDDLLYAMDTYATLYGLAPAGDYEAAYDFDDSVIVDKDAQMSGDRQAVGMGAMPKFVFLMRNYGLDEATAGWPRLSGCPPPSSGCPRPRRPCSGR